MLHSQDIGRYLQNAGNIEALHIYTPVLWNMPRHSFLDISMLRKLRYQLHDHSTTKLEHSCNLPQFVAATTSSLGLLPGATRMNAFCNNLSPGRYALQAIAAQHYRWSHKQSKAQKSRGRRLPAESHELLLTHTTVALSARSLGRRSNADFVCSDRTMAG